MESCGNCIFYKEVAESLILTGQRSMICRRFPPGGHLVMQSVGGQAMAQFIYRQAETKPDGWCGEWKLLTVKQSQENDGNHPDCD
jgi:hypothetical protein